MARRYLVGAKGARLLAIGGGAILTKVRPGNPYKASVQAPRSVISRDVEFQTRAGRLAPSLAVGVVKSHPKIHGTTRHEEGPTTNELSPLGACL